jgi:hypothetical protein
MWKKINRGISNFASNLIFPFECVGPPIKFVHYQDLRQVSFDSLFSQFSSFDKPSILDVWSRGMKFCYKLVQSRFLCLKVLFCYLFIANNFHSFNDNYNWYYCWKIMHDITNVEEALWYAQAIHLCFDWQLEIELQNHMLDVKTWIFIFAISCTVSIVY